MPNSLAICAIGLPLVCANRTASRLNSAVKVRAAFFILVHPLSGSRIPQIFPYSTKPGEVHKELSHHLDVLESERAIRRLMAEYLEARDFSPGSSTRIARLFSADGVWEGVGRLAEVLGSHQGRDAIERRFSAPLPFSVHFLTNELITIDGDTAVGTWRYLQSTVYKGQAVWIAGRYHNDFVRVEGLWKFQHVRIDAVFVTPYEDGWVKTAFLA